VMGQEGIVSIKEQTKGVETIVAVDHAHEALKNFHLREDDVEEKKPEESKEKESPHIQELYKVTAHVAPLFKTFNNCKYVRRIVVLNQIKFHVFTEKGTCSMHKLLANM
jgi:hypothetical protein